VPAVAILTSVHEPFDPRVFHKQARTLAAAGYRVTLLAPYDRDETCAGVRVRGLPRPRARTGRPLLWLRLLRAALRLHADVYHLHDPELLPLGLLLAAVTGRPVVYDAHEYYRDEIATRRWLPRPLRRPAAAAVHVLETLAARRLAAVVAVNEHMAAGFRSRGARRVVTVHNYPPLDLFLNVPRGAPSRPVAVYTGLLTRERGLEIIWHAGRRLRALVPEAEVRVVGRIDWAGVDPTVPRAPARWREEVGTVLCGVVPAHEVPGVLAAATVGWIPFQHTPNNARAVPLKLLEYMAAGLPVVASDLGFLGRIVRREECGLLVPPDDPEAHARALARLLTHPDEARTLGDRGRRAVEARYTWEVEAKRLLALYAELTP
jgi:glycosyltransferase involved in cell wall biosynthesis